MNRALVLDMRNMGAFDWVLAVWPLRTRWESHAARVAQPGAREVLGAAGHARHRARRISHDATQERGEALRAASKSGANERPAASR